MKPKNITPDNLPQIIARKTNRDKASLRQVLKNRLTRAVELQRLSKIKGSREGKKDLTAYANSLLDNDLQPLYRLLYDYSGSRMTITHVKHAVLQDIRRSRAANVKQQLKQALMNMYNNYRITGQIRNSDKMILNSLK